MVEVFKTNISERFHADMLLEEIHRTFKGYKANFDLDDCDRILRVKSSADFIPTAPLIKLLNDFGFYAEPLPDDDIPVGFSRMMHMRVEKK